MNKKVEYENILDESLSKVLQGEETIDSVVKAYSQWENQLKATLETAQWLSDQGQLLTPRTGFLKSSNQYMASHLMVTNLRRQFNSKAFGQVNYLRRFMITILILFVVFLGGAGLVIVGGESLPGDAFYPIKITTENLRLALTLQPSKEAYLHLQFAQEHLIACAILASQGQYNDAEIARRHYEHHMVGAGRLVPVFSQNGLNAEMLFSNFNRIYLQDIKTIQVILPGGF